MVSFYKHNITDWRGGTAHLSDRAYRVYHMIVEQIRLYEGPIPAHERTLAGLSNRSVRDLQAALKELTEAGKITISGELIHNNRAESELVSVRKNRENAASGGRTPREKSANTPRVVTDETEKNNKNNDETEAAVQQDGSLKEKRREEKKEPSVVSLFGNLDASPVGSADGQPVQKKTRGSRLPADWSLPAEWRAYAESKGFRDGPLLRMAERFANFWHGKAGKDAVKADWYATWRNWVLTELDKRPTGNVSPQRENWPSV